MSRGAQRAFYGGWVVIPERRLTPAAHAVRLLVGQRPVGLGALSLLSNSGDCPWPAQYPIAPVPYSRIAREIDAEVARIVYGGGHA